MTARPFNVALIDSEQVELDRLLASIRLSGLEQESALAAYPADYRVWCQNIDDREIPVIDSGTFRIT
jgi:hypothetical protein